VLVGTCFTDGTPEEFLIQHHSKSDQGGAEIVPSATPSFCTGTASASRNTGWTPFAVARRVLDLFRPQPLLATALGVRPPGGSVGALSPHGAVNPGQITLAFQGQIKDGRTNQDIVFTNGKDVSVAVTPEGETKMDGVRIRLIATTNLGVTVSATGNEVATVDGVATFPDLQINKAGGYRLIATIAGFGQNGNGGFDFDNITSNGFNLKQLK